MIENSQLRLVTYIHMKETEIYSYIMADHTNKEDTEGVPENLVRWNSELIRSKKDGLWPKIYVKDLKLGELFVTLIRHYLDEDHIEVNHQVYTELLLTESEDKLDKCNETQP
jgi:hypothetical protein